MQHKNTTETLRCNLTDDEKMLAGKELAESTNTLTQLEEDKAQIVADFKARTTAAEAKISILSNKIRSGYEFRQVECRVEFDKPEPGLKITTRMDTFEIIRTENMSDDEKQQQLELN